MTTLCWLESCQRNGRCMYNPCQIEGTRPGAIRNATEQAMEHRQRMEDANNTGRQLVVMPARRSGKTYEAAKGRLLQVVGGANLNKVYGMPSQVLEGLRADLRAVLGDST